MATKIICTYFFNVTGNQTQASLHARCAAVPLDLSLPQLWGLIPNIDVTHDVGTAVQRDITLTCDTGTAAITAHQKANPTTGEVDSLTLGSTSGYFAAPPILSFSAFNPDGGQGAAAVPIMGVKVAVIANSGTGYNGATTTAKLVGGNIAPGGVPATLGAITLIGGVVTNVVIATPGSGYTTFPQIVITDTGVTPGSGAEIFGGLNLVGVTLTNPGKGYSAPPTVTVNPYFQASNTEFGTVGEVNDFDFANWMTGPIQNACRTPSTRHFRRSPSSMWFYDSSRQALIFFDPERGGQGMGYSIPAIERAKYWEPKGQLELEIRKCVSKLPQASQIIRPR